MAEHKMPAPVAWIVSEQNQIGSTSDYLRWNRGGAPKSMGKAAEALYSAETVQALQAECEEQARLNGMGAEREVRLMARVSELEAEVERLREEREQLIQDWVREQGMRSDAEMRAERAELERDRLASTDAGAALGLLVRMRFACGDNGLRMQDELEDYLRELARDAARYRWLHVAENYPDMDWWANKLSNTCTAEKFYATVDAAMAEGVR